MLINTTAGEDYTINRAEQIISGKSTNRVVGVSDTATIANLLDTIERLDGVINTFINRMNTDNDTIQHLSSKVKSLEEEIKHLESEIARLS